jgi:1-aminocyclopropane-1-carboxylate deaminase
LPLADVARLAPVQRLNWQLAEECGLEVVMRREDLLHPRLGGNKFYKLAGHIDAFRRSGAHCLLSFGGAFSNHLYALAAAGHELGIPTVGIVRGERPKSLSPTLQDAADQGMELVFISRAEYRRKADPQWLAQLRHRFADAYVIPEGGGDALGSTGCMAWATAAAAASPWRPDVICVAAGTGGTAAGVLAAGVSAQVEAFLVLSGTSAEVADMQTEIVTRACTLTAKERVKLPSFHLETNYACGGYARLPSPLRHFMAAFEEETGVPLDPVYTAKMMWGIAHKAREGQWPPGTRILVLHSGGLQGRRGFPAL